MVREIATLCHKAGNDSVEFATFESQGLVRLLSIAFLACAQTSEVLGSFGSVLGVQCDLNSSSLLTANLDIEIHLGLFIGDFRFA